MISIRVNAGISHVFIEMSDDHHESGEMLTPAEARALAAELTQAANAVDGICPAECDRGWKGSYPCYTCYGTGKVPV